MTDDQARILSAEMDAIQQELVELRARDRARAMATRRTLLALIDDIEREWGYCPRTSELRKGNKSGPISTYKGKPITDLLDKEREELMAALLSRTL